MSSALFDEGDYYLIKESALMKWVFDFTYYTQ